MWAYNSDSGAVQSLPSWQSWAGWLALKSGSGWHGPFNSKQDALNYYETNKAANPGWKAPTGVAGNLTNSAGAVVGEVTKPVTDALGNFNVGGWFIRVGEILLGLILIGVGVAKLTGTTNLVASAVKAKI